jgi:hypothetical protein
MTCGSFLSGFPQKRGIGIEYDAEAENGRWE